MISIYVLIHITQMNNLDMLFLKKNRKEGLFCIAVEVKYMISDENQMRHMRSPAELKQLHISLKEQLKINPLTRVEREICQFLFDGKTAKEIAVVRDCSFRTVERHIANIKTKLREGKLSPATLFVINHSDFHFEGI